jgi:hypothetical protein
MKNNKSSTYSVPSIIQKLFVGTVGGSFILYLIFTLYQFFSQYPDVLNDIGSYSFILLVQGVPLLLFVIAYAFNPRSLKLLERCFESIVLALGGVTAWSYITNMTYSSISTFVDSYANPQVAITLTFVVVYSLGLFWLRSSKRWQ